MPFLKGDFYWERMDKDFINPFIEATVHVVKTLAFTNAHAGKPFQRETGFASGDISGLISLTGGAKGSVSVSFTEACILSLVSRMFGDEMNEVNEEIMDAAGEIANMISGHARQKLEENGTSLKAGIPTVIAGKNHSISHISGNPVTSIPFNTDFGGFTVEVCLEN
jgi:chemotaxis protein CheX